MPGTACPNCGRVFEGDVPKYCNRCGTGLAVPEEDIRKALQKAAEALRTCDIRAAVPHMEHVARISPKCSDVWFMFALANIRDTQKQEMYLGMAENSENTSLDLFGKDDICRFEEAWRQESGQVISKAKQLLLLGNRNAATELMNRASLMNPGCADVWYLRAALTRDPVLRSRYVKAAGGKPVSMGLFGREDLTEHRERMQTAVRFIWEQPNPELRIDIAIPGAAPISLNPGNGYTTEAELPNGAVRGRATMVGNDGCSVGTPLDFTIRVSPGADFILVNQGIFKSKLAFKDTEM